jgi:hypothetical protein
MLVLQLEVGYIRTATIYSDVRDMSKNYKVPEINSIAVKTSRKTKKTSLQAENIVSPNFKYAFAIKDIFKDNSKIVSELRLYSI